jgi:hypothetical protein
MGRGWRRSVGREDAELTRFADGGGGASGPDDRFGWHATHIKAIAAHEMLLDQGDLRAQSGRPTAVTNPAVPAPMTTRL